MQDSFLKCIMDAGDDEILSYIKPSNIDSNIRLAIYRNTIIENLTNALSLTFPGIWKLIGDNCAASVAYAFSKELSNLPGSGDLDNWGEKFPAFLEKFPSLAELIYLKDFAQLEWLQQLSYGAPEANTVPIAQLQQIPAEAIDSLCFKFHPSVFLHKSKFPLDKILAVTEDPNAERVNLDSGPAFAVICRHEGFVKIFWLRIEQWHFIYLLKEGKSLRKAASMIMEQSPEFDLTEILSFIFSKGLISE